MSTPTAQLIALTTPFVQPDGCESQWTTTSFDDRGTAVITIIESKAVSSCYPSGWEGDRPKNSRFHFSPAVCPSGWTYYKMAESTQPGKSTAFCCNSGYTFPEIDKYELGTKEWDFETYCRLETSSSTSTSDRDDVSATSSDLTVRLHEAWAITWDATDTPTLTPELPPLTSSSMLPTWTAGQVVSEDDYTGGPAPVDNGTQIPDSLYWFMVVGIPIIFVALVGSCVWCCVRSCTKKKRERVVIIPPTAFNTQTTAKEQK